MMNWIISVSTALVLAGAAAFAHAQQQSNAVAGVGRDDLRCLVISMVEYSKESFPGQYGSVASMLYWQGRVDAFLPQAERKARILKEMDALLDISLMPEAKRCAQEMKDAQDAMQSIGGEMDSKIGALRDKLKLP